MPFFNKTLACISQKLELQYTNNKLDLNKRVLGLEKLPGVIQQRCFILLT